MGIGKTTSKRWSELLAHYFTAGLIVSQGPESRGSLSTINTSPGSNAPLIVTPCPSKGRRSTCRPSAYLGRMSYCLLYTSDAADEEDSVDLGGRRIIKKTK